MFQSKIKVDFSNSQCNQHGKPLIQVNIEKECQGMDRLMCSECITNQRGVYHAMSILEANENIESVKIQQQQQILDSIRSIKQIIEELKEKTNKLQSRIYESISSIIQKFDDYCLELDNLVEQYNNCDLLRDLDNICESPYYILERQFLIDTKKMQSINQSYSTKVLNLTQKLQSIIMNWNLQNVFDQIFNQISTSINNYKIQNGQPTWNKVQEIKQQKSCWAIAFNKSNTIMATGCEEKIQIWNFQDKQFIESGILLEGHSDYIQCLVFSKNQNWFVSSGLDEKIICWNQINKEKWQGKEYLNTGQGIIQCLILTSTEDQLISCHDSIIKVWNLSIQCNTISFKQLLNMHRSTVESICINDNSQYLISSAADNQIILYSRNSQQDWSYQNTINQDTKDSGNRLIFISNTTFVQQQNKQGILLIYNLENGQFKVKPQGQFKLREHYLQDTTRLFPSIFNKEKNILIQKHNNYVYILKYDDENSLKLYGDPIYCLSKFNYGSLTNDGNYLVIWNLETRSLNVYQIK